MCKNASRRTVSKGLALRYSLPDVYGDICEALDDEEIRLRSASTAEDAALFVECDNAEGLLFVTDSDAPSVTQEYRYEAADGGIH